MRRLLLVTTGLGVGGAETQLVQLANRLKHRGWEIRVVSLIPPGALAEELKKNGIPVVTLGMRRSVPDLRALGRLVRVIRSWRPHVVHSHMFHANLLARLVRPWAPAPVLICTAHNTYEASHRATVPRERTWREWAYRITDPLCDLTTQVSQAGLERYVRVKAVPANKLALVPNGIDTDRFRPDPVARKRIRAALGLDDTFVWLAVGRLEPQKDYPTLLRAVAHMGDPKATLLVAGEGALRVELERLTHELGRTERVRFLGRRGDVPALMSAADAFVLSSAWEGFGLVLVEAMACGLPVVATDSGGPREILDEGRLGFLVPPREPEALAGAMLRLMSLPSEERARMGRAGRAHVQANYSLERVVDQWEALYLELLAGKGVQVE